MKHQGKTKQLNFGNFVTAFILILMAVLAVQSCFISSSSLERLKSIDDKITTKGLPSNQMVTPANPTAISSTCGHSMYYNESQHPGSGIINGVTARQNEYPWIVRLFITGFAGSTECGGSVISKNYILTAAHCLSELPVSNITVYLGEYNKFLGNDTGELVIPASSWTMHNSYDWESHDYDYGLVELSTNLVFTSWVIQPICLPDSCLSACVTTGSTVYIAGWGSTNIYGGTTARYLQRAYLEVADWYTCRSQYPYLSSRMICAGYLAGGIDTCQGDSGGPLMNNEDGYFKLCGVTSHGNGCAQANNFGVYANVCKVIPWIKTIAGIS